MAKKIISTFLAIILIAVSLFTISPVYPLHTKASANDHTTICAVFLNQTSIIDDLRWIFKNYTKDSDVLLYSEDDFHKQLFWGKGFNHCDVVNFQIKYVHDEVDIWTNLTYSFFARTYNGIIVFPAKTESQKQSFSFLKESYPNKQIFFIGEFDPEYLEKNNTLDQEIDLLAHSKFMRGKDNEMYSGTFVASALFSIEVSESLKEYGKERVLSDIKKTLKKKENQQTYDYERDYDPNNLFNYVVASKNAQFDFTNEELEKMEKKIKKIKENLNENGPITCIFDTPKGNHEDLVREAFQIFSEEETVVYGIEDLKNLIYYDHEVNFNHCSVINISMSLRSELMESTKNYHTFQRLFSSFDGMIVFSAANDETQNFEKVQHYYDLVHLFPQKREQMLFVGTYDHQNKKNMFSFGENIDYIAPTKDICLSSQIHNGTSFSAPAVSATIANIYKEKGRIRPQEIRDILDSRSVLVSDHGIIYKNLTLDKDTPRCY